MVFQFLQKKSVKAVITAAVLFSMVSTAFAGEPWTAYNYDWWWDTYPVQSGYVVDRVITSNELKLDKPMASPEDVFIYKDGEGTVSVFIVDTDNHRIIITDENFENVRQLKNFFYDNNYKVENFRPVPDTAGNVAQEDIDRFKTEFEKVGTPTTLRRPTGIYVQNYHGETRIYIPDSENERVIACSVDLSIPDKSAESEDPQESEEAESEEAAEQGEQEESEDNAESEDDSETEDTAEPESEEEDGNDESDGEESEEDSDESEEEESEESEDESEQEDGEESDEEESEEEDGQEEESESVDETEGDVNFENEIKKLNLEDNEVLGRIWMEYQKPINEAYESKSSFNPNKVLADNAGNVYVSLKTTEKGAIMYNEEGIFRGYYGANRVTKTSTAMLNYVLRFFMSREMMEQRTKPTPVEFTNFTIDDDQFIYTVTRDRDAGVDVVKKLNPSGQNVFSEQGYDDWIWGAYMPATSASNETLMSTMVDINIDETGDIFLLDDTSRQVYQYNDEGWLVFTFGGEGDMKGLFRTPVALETLDGKVYVLDKKKNSLTVFKPSEFGDLVIEAMNYFNRGKYRESMEPWEEVLKRDENFFLAYTGMGNAKLSVGEFEEAMDYFYMHSGFGYDRAFKDYRVHYMRENFDRFLVVGAIAIVILLGGHFAVKAIRKRKKSKDES